MPDYYTEKEKKRAIDSFSAEDKAISAENPEYGAKLAQIKQNYNASTTDEERDAWHNEAEKLSNEYGYTRNDDGSDVKALSSNLKTIQNFDKAYGKEDKNGYQSLINALLADLSGAKFTYSAKDDPRYTLAQEYASDAMRNQMAESAALTGGYGNSYAAESGQKVYDSYIDSAVNDMEDRAYTRWKNEQNDKYTQLNTLIGLDNTQYSRQRDAISDARYSDETAYNRQRDAIEDARYENEIALSKEQTDYTRSQSEKADAQNRIMTYLESGGDPSKLDSKLIATSGLTDAEISAIRSGVLQDLASKTSAQTVSESVGSTLYMADAYKKLRQMGVTDYYEAYSMLIDDGFSDTQAKNIATGISEGGKTGDAEGLFIAAYNSGDPHDYIAKNYKDFGFDSASGLQQRYRDEFSEEIGAMDVSQSNADAYIEENGINPSSVISRESFYSANRIVGGVTYGSYADYIDAVVEKKIAAGAKRSEFLNKFSGFLGAQASNK